MNEARRGRQQRSIELAAPIQITPLEYFYKKEIKVD